MVDSAIIDKLNRAICIYQGAVYYADDHDLIQHFDLGDRDVMAMNGYDYELISDGIKMKEFLDAVAELSLSAKSFKMRNLVRCRNLCNDHEGFDVSFVLKEFLNYLKAARYKSARTPTVQTAQKKKEKPKQDAVRDLAKKYKMSSAFERSLKDIPDALIGAFGGYVQDYWGITEWRKDGSFDVRFDLNCRILTQDAARVNWANDKAKELAKYAIKHIRVNADSAKHLDGTAVYTPINMGTSIYGAVTITFKPTKAKKNNGG